jgi:hypothetical protein
MIPVAQANFSYPSLTQGSIAKAGPTYTGSRIATQSSANGQYGLLEDVE